MGLLRQNCNHKSIFIYKKYKKRLKVFQSFFILFVNQDWYLLFYYIWLKFFILA